MSDSTSCACCGSADGPTDAAAEASLTETLPVSIDEALRTRIPEDVSPALKRAYDMDDEPATLGAWIDGMMAAYAARGEDPGPEDMCAVEEARHAIEFDGGDEPIEYICVLDPLAAPFVEDHPATVRSDPPVGDGVVEFRIGPDGITVEPDGAVVSFGVDAPSSAAPLSVEETYDRLCPYGHAFPSEAAYEQWDEERDGIATMAIDAETAVGLSAGLAEFLQSSP